MRMRRARKHQKGSISLSGGKWYVRYYGTDRLQRSEFLHVKDDEFHSPECKAVTEAAARVMARVNAENLRSVGERFNASKNA
jgi:hypothetical protein